jgi:rhodanese-related sulfurtransferase
MTGTKFITAKELEQMMPMIVKGECVLLDIRTASEFRSGHIIHAILMPVEELEKRSAELTGTKKMVIYCRTGKRCHRALPILNEKGHNDIMVLEGGLEKWSREIVRE